MRNGLKIIVVIMLIALPATALVSMGDVNGDGHITMADAIMALQMAVGIREPDPSTADMNGDGKVTSLDALMISKIATTTPTPVPTPTPDSVTDHIVWNSSFDVHEFDGTIKKCFQYPHNPDYDIGDEFTIRMWFRRDVFNKQQFFLSKGHWEDKLGWRFMVKQTKPPYQAEQIQFDVGDGSELNYYKTLQGITDSDWYCIVFVWNANKIYVDSKGTATHGALILDGKADYYMARSDTKKPVISEVKPYRSEMYVGRHFCKGKFFYVGAMANIEMLDTDIGIDGAVEYYESTKDAYPPAVA